MVRWKCSEKLMLLRVEESFSPSCTKQKNGKWSEVLENINLSILNPEHERCWTFSRVDRKRILNSNGFQVMPSWDSDPSCFEKSISNHLVNASESKNIHKLNCAKLHSPPTCNWQHFDLFACCASCVVTLIHVCLSTHVRLGISRS